MKMKRFFILGFFHFISCFEHNKCKIFNAPERYKDVCDSYRCRRILEPAHTSVTCRNLDQMHATPNLCLYKCTLQFSGENRILRTNSFSQVSNLERVFLNDTSIRTLQMRVFTGCRLLELIHLERNQITKISKNTFSQLKNLISLKLSYNKIDEIDPESFNGCDSMNYIDLSHNNLKNLSTTLMESMLQLKTVNLSSNSLDIMDPNWCFHFHFLKTLVFDYNRIESLANCTLSFNLEFFSITHNYLSALNGSYFPVNLQYLNLRGNRISILKNEPFRHLSKLRILDISNNKLENLPFELFVDLKNLSYLDISSNNLMTLQEGVFHGLASLKFLNLSTISVSNFESRVFYSTKSIESLDISRNNIQYFDTNSLLKFCRNLKYLKIDENSFTCEALAEIFMKAEQKEVEILGGSSYKSRNLNGNKCFENQPGSLSINYTNQVMDYFEKGFRKSSFFKFFSSFKQPSEIDLQRLAEIDKNILKNISLEIAKLENKLLKDFLLEEKDRSNKDSTNEILGRLLNYLETNRISQDKNFTSDVFTILEQQSRAALTVENTDMKDMISLLKDLKFMFIICSLILISFCVVKLFKRLKTHFPIKKLNIESQELPFIEQRNASIQ